MQTMRPVLRCPINRRVSWLWLGLALTACSDPAGTGPDPVPLVFTDQTAESGIDFVHVDGFSGEYYYVETFGSGAAFVDVDGDGWQDLYLVNGAPLAG